MISTRSDRRCMSYDCRGTSGTGWAWSDTYRRQVVVAEHEVTNIEGVWHWFKHGVASTFVDNCTSWLAPIRLSIYCLSQLLPILSTWACPSQSVPISYPILIKLWKFPDRSLFQNEVTFWFWILMSPFLSYFHVMTFKKITRPVLASSAKDRLNPDRLG